MCCQWIEGDSDCFDGQPSCCAAVYLQAMVLEGPGMRTNVPRLLEILSHKVFAERQVGTHRKREPP